MSNPTTPPVTRKDFVKAWLSIALLIVGSVACESNIAGEPSSFTTYPSPAFSFAEKDVKPPYDRTPPAATDGARKELKMIHFSIEPWESDFNSSDYNEDELSFLEDDDPTLFAVLTGDVVDLWAEAEGVV